MEILHAKVGDRVRVRRRNWVVQNVDSYDSCRVLALETDGRLVPSHTCRVIQPFDDVVSANLARHPTRVGIRAWRGACRALIASDGDAAALRTAASSRFDLLSYQLEPALALLRGRGARVLIADDVGLGKTVQAMLACAELLARGMAARVLVLCPAGLREQWAEECWSRFGLRLTVFEHTSIRRMRSTLPVGINPWKTESLAIASIDFVKRPEVLPLVSAATWDVVVVDEAHGSSGDSDRREAVARLCEQAPYVVLLTATPHSGDEEAFASLCRFGQLGDPLIVFRRSRLEAGRDAGRRAHIINSAECEAERGMRAALEALTRAIRREATQIESHVWLMLALFHKRALSCPYALVASVERRLQLLGTDAFAGHEQLRLPLDDETGDLDGTDSAPMWAAPALRDTGKERRLLEQLAEAGRHAQGHSSKLRRLHRLLGRLKEPAIVFTEYRDTLLHVQTQVAPGASIVHGGMTREQRRAALAAFPASGLLLATDAASEGLNLQQHCRTVINLELPWNPMRLEQRVGRVDRIGQRRRVHVFYMVSSGTGETRLLDRLSARVSHAVARVGAPDPMCGRPSWTEEQSARLVVLSEDSTPASAASNGPSIAMVTAPLNAPSRERCGATGSPPGSMPPPAVPLTRLRIEAERETARLRTVRHLATAHIAAPAPTNVVTAWPTTSRRRRSAAHVPLIAHTRRSTLRRSLGGRTLAIFRTAIHDAAGHVVATRVEAVLAADEPEHATGVRAWELLASNLDSSTRHAWIEEACRIHEQVTQLRMRRARTIADLCASNPSEHQPGLFDRRVEHTIIEQRGEQDTARATSEERVARALAASRVVVGSPELVLLLFSHRRALRS